jgi:3D (Asp-Asp-Asp) domain-containing protein
LAIHLRWIRRGLGGGRTRLVALYLCCLAGLIGYGCGPLSREAAQWAGWAGTGRTPMPSTPPPEGMAWVEVMTTAYCPCAICCGDSADGRTANNRDVKKFPHGIAAENRILPIGTYLFIPGYGEFMVDDTGGAMRQSAKRGVVHLDLRFAEHQVARRWGRQWHWILVAKELPAAKPPAQWPSLAR